MFNSSLSNRNSNHANVCILRRDGDVLEVDLFDPMKTITGEKTKLMDDLIMKLKAKYIRFIPGSQQVGQLNCFSLCLDYLRKFICDTQFNFLARCEVARGISNEQSREERLKQREKKRKALSELSNSSENLVDSLKRKISDAISEPVKKTKFE